MAGESQLNHHSPSQQHWLKLENHYLEDKNFENKHYLGYFDAVDLHWLVHDDVIEIVLDNVVALVAIDLQWIHLASLPMKVQHWRFEIAITCLWQNDAQTHVLHVDLKTVFHASLDEH